MKDAVGQELHIGDRVAYIVTSPWAGMQLIGQFQSIQTGTIEKINKSTVSLKDTSYNHKSWYASGECYKTRKVPHRVVKLG